MAAVAAQEDDNHYDRLGALCGWRIEAFLVRGDIERRRGAQTRSIEKFCRITDLL